MIINLLPMCYHPSHQPFSGSQAANCQTVDSEKPASKLIRAVLRVSEIDPQTWTQYSIHKCHCKSKGREKYGLEDELDSSQTLDQLGIKEGDSIFFRKIDVGEEEMEEEEQDSTPRRFSRKRKETDYKDDDYYHNPSQSVSCSTSERPTSNPPSGPAAVAQVFSNLENQTSKAARAARYISKLLGGDDWKIQSIGKLGPIQTKGEDSLWVLLRLVKTSLEIRQALKSGRSGFFNSDLIEALTRAYHQRMSNSSKGTGDNQSSKLGSSDYERANELLKGKIEQDGSWEKSSLSHLDESSLSTPTSRFPLDDKGLSERALNAARAVCVLWNNEKWIDQAPLPGLSPISLKQPSQFALLRQIAQITKVRLGEATPDGLPPIVLKALRESIRKNQESFKSNPGAAAPFGWSQNRCLKDALVLLKERIGGRKEGSSSTTHDSGEASGSRDTEERNVRRRLDVGK